MQTDTSKTKVKLPEIKSATYLGCNLGIKSISKEELQTILQHNGNNEKTRPMLQF